MEITIFLDPHFDADDADDVMVTLEGLTPEQYEALTVMINDTVHYDWR